MGTQKPGFLPVLKAQIQYLRKKRGFFGCSASKSGSLNADRPLFLFLKKGQSQLKIVSFQECRIQSRKLHLEYTAAKLSGDRRHLDG
jgi:hypothetical protein